MDTSVIGALYDKEDPLRIKTTEKLLQIFRIKKQYDPYISNIFIEEVEEAPDTIREPMKNIIKDVDFYIIMENDESAQLLDAYMKEKIINPKYRDNARHVSLSVVNNMDIIVSWNCKHLCNIHKKRKFNAVNILMGYKEIDIITPLEVIDDD